MKNLTLPLFFVFSGLTIHAQTFEYSKDRGFSNQIPEVLNLGDTMWVVAENYQTGTVGEMGSFISAFDVGGNQLWEYETDFSNNNQRVFELTLTPDNQITVMGSFGIPCDVGDMIPLVIMKLSSEGEFISESVHEISIHGFYNDMVSYGLNEQLVFSSLVMDPESWGEAYKLFGFNHTGDSLLWTADWSDSEIHGLASVNNNMAVFADNHMVLVGASGNRTDSLMYDAPPIDAVTLPDSQLLLMWSDGVYKLDNNLTLEQVIEFEDGAAASGILLQNESIYIWFGDELTRYSLDFEWEESTTFNLLPYFSMDEIGLNASSLALVGYKSHEENLVYSGGSYRSGAMALHSLSGDEQVYDADVEVSSFQITSFNQNLVSEDPPLFNFYVDVSGYVVNVGNEIIQDVNVNYLGDMGICGVESQRLTLTDLNLLPGDSVLFEMEDLARLYVYASSGRGSIEFCVFASSPSHLYDRDETNDAGCATENYGVGINETIGGITTIYPNPARNHILFGFSETEKSGQLQIHDYKGQLISEENIDHQNLHQLDVSSWPAGIYVARILSGAQVSQATKFTIAK